MSQLYLIISSALMVYSYILIIYILMSWFPGARDSQFGHFLGQISEPYLEQFRRIIPPLGMIDISPIVAIIVLRFAQHGLAQLFMMIGW